jgi:hypothetical protein
MLGIEAADVFEGIAFPHTKLSDKSTEPIITCCLSLLTDTTSLCHTEKLQYKELIRAYKVILHFAIV